VAAVVDGSAAVQGMCRVQDQGAPGVDGLGLAAVDDLGGEQPETGVPMVVVVGVEELGAELAGLLERGEGAGEGQAVLQGLELRLAVRVVVAHPSPSGSTPCASGRASRVGNGSTPA